VKNRFGVERKYNLIFFPLPSLNLFQNGSDVKSKELPSQRGEITWHFLLPGGSIGPSYVFATFI